MTILEMLIAMMIFSIIMLVIVQAMSRVQTTWVQTRDKIREAVDGRAAFETLARQISRATLHERQELGGDDLELVRESDLHFVCGPAKDLLQQNNRLCGHAVFFQAPMGYEGTDNRPADTASSSEEPAEYGQLPSVLNAWGFFVEFAADPSALPASLTAARQIRTPESQRHRFRLMEFRQPAHELPLFQLEPNDPPRVRMAELRSQAELYEWFAEPLQNQTSLATRRSTVIAENILAVIINPEEIDNPALSSTASLAEKIEVAPNYLYDSRRHQWDTKNDLSVRGRHRLPPVLRVTMVVLDEEDWARLEDSEALSLGTQLRSRLNSMFSSTKNFDQDMGSLIGELNRLRLRHRVLSTLVQLPGGRWSADEPSSS